MPAWAWRVLTIVGFVVAVNLLPASGWASSIIGSVGMVLFLSGLDATYQEKRK